MVVVALSCGYAVGNDDVSDAIHTQQHRIQNESEALRRLAWPYLPTCRNRKTSGGVFVSSLVPRGDPIALNVSELPNRARLAINRVHERFVLWEDGMVRISTTGCDWSTMTPKLESETLDLLAPRNSNFVYFWEPGQQEIYRLDAKSREIDVVSGPVPLNVMFSDARGRSVAAINYDNCRLLISNDDGISWVSNDLPFNDCGGSIGAKLNDLVAVLRPDGTLSISSDGGKNWRRQSANCARSQCEIDVVIVEVDFSAYVWIAVGPRISLYEIVDGERLVSGVNLGRCTSSKTNLFVDEGVPKIVVGVVATMESCGDNSQTEFYYLAFKRATSRLQSGKIGNIEIPPGVSIQSAIVNPGSSSATWISLAKAVRKFE